MATKYDSIEDRYRKVIEKQHIFFVGTAAEDGRVNISPKGMDSLKVMGPNRLIWRNLTGSGNETAGHLLRVNRMTVMWCTFEGPPNILRAYGTARTVHRNDPDWEALNGLFPEAIGARQVYDMTVEMFQQSCGYAVPLYDYREDREVLTSWAEQRGPEGLRAYWADRNRQTIDGMETGIVAGNLSADAKTP